MANLNLIDQETYRAQIAPKINQLKAQLDLRQEIWNKLDRDKKVKWIKSGKDPIMTLAWQMFKYLRDNFFGEVDDG